MKNKIPDTTREWTTEVIQAYEEAIDTIPFGLAPASRAATSNRQHDRIQPPPRVAIDASSDDNADTAPRHTPLGDYGS